MKYSAFGRKIILSSKKVFLFRLLVWSFDTTHFEVLDVLLKFQWKHPNNGLTKIFCRERDINGGSVFDFFFFSTYLLASSSPPGHAQLSSHLCRPTTYCEQWILGSGHLFSVYFWKNNQTLHSPCNTARILCTVETWPSSFWLMKVVRLSV